MSARSRIVSADEELGKRDDDFFRSRRSRSTSSSPVASSFIPWRWRKRRVLTALAVIAVVYVFMYNLPTGSPVPQDPTVRPIYTPSYTPTVPHRASGEPAGAPSRDPDEEEDEATKHWYNGVVRFYKLAENLHKISRTGGTVTQNRNVLFVASSLKSMANLIPMACEMARIEKNFAHLALFGRSTIPMDELLEINGVDLQSCTVFWHDARGDFPEYSSDARAESATRGAMKHINDFMHPQAMIMDDSAKEELFFTRAMRTKAKEFGRPLIEIPAGKYEDFMWMTRLEANNLSGWFIPTIDIVIQAPRGSSGSLIRLVKSLQNADYRGLQVPRLTIELPSDVGHYVQRFLHDLQWPPVHDSLPFHPNMLTLHHRIPSSRQSSEQASLRFVESFYPSRPESNHVLILSPQAEVSPRFLQYLHYQILEHRYAPWISSTQQSMLGISLDVPSTFLNGTAGFSPPVGENVTEETASPFLYQAPSSTATLIFGDKWSQFHSFLSQRTSVNHDGKKTAKLVSETEPAWMEYLLELMRARDWTVLHPAATANLVTVHNELAQVPEEFTRPAPETPKEQVPKTEDNGEAFLLSDEPPVLVERVEKDEHASDGVPLHSILNPDTAIWNLPILAYDGRLITEQDKMNASMEYREFFRKSFGGCDDKDAKKRRVVDDTGASDLFCFPGQVIEEVPEMDWAFGGEDVELPEALGDGRVGRVDLP